MFALKVLLPHFWHNFLWFIWLLWATDGAYQHQAAYKEIPLSLISCLLWQWKKLLYQSDISQEGGKTYESEERKKRKLSLLKIHLIAGKMAHTLILQASLICFSKPLRDLFDQTHSTWSFFVYFTANLSLFKKTIYKSVPIGFTIFKMTWNLVISPFLKLTRWLVENNQSVME